MGPPLGRTRGGPRYGGPQYGHGPPPEYAAQADSPVIMVYGLDPFKINADRIFNIFCLYGNVERVSLLKPNFTSLFLIAECKSDAQFHRLTCLTVAHQT